MKLPEWKKRLFLVSFHPILPIFTLSAQMKTNSILNNPRYITNPAKSKTDSWANVYRDGRLFKQKKIFSFWIYKQARKLQDAQAEKLTSLKAQDKTS